MPATLESRLPLIAAELRPLVSAAVKAGATVVAERAKEKVALGPEPYHLRDDIHVERVGPAEYAVVAGEPPNTFYGHILEFGSSKMAPHPFLIPALEENEDTVVELVQSALEGL